MTKDLLAFPEGFRWGVATAAHQNEGNNCNNNWALWEQTPGRIYGGAVCGDSTNWWDLDVAAQDFDRAAGLGLNALRISVEWSRIEPEPGAFDVAALDHYRALVRLLHQRGLEPMVTLHHFTDPLWLVHEGAWENPLVLDYFSRFTGQVVEALTDDVHLWCTINEPIVYAFMGFKDGRFPPGAKSLPRTITVLRNMLLAHGRAYRTIHRLQNETSVGLAHHLRYFLPENPDSRLDRLAARWMDQLANRSTLEAVTTGRLTFPVGAGQTVSELIDASDFIGLNYYTTTHVAFDRAQAGMMFVREYLAPGPNPCESTSSGEVYCEINPEGIYLALQQCAAYGKPIYITENGLPDRDDDQRPYLLASYLPEVWRAIRDGADVRGYYHWTLVDNFEWAEAWNLRFGLFELDPATGVRTPRNSANIYGGIAKANGVARPIIERYAPERVGQYFE